MLAQIEKMKLKLNYNQQVDFFEENHLYLKKDGTVLKGITGMISKMLFPDKYKNIPTHILNKAAEYGSLIHSKCQTQDMFDTDADCIELENYILIKKEYNLIPIDNEYLVSDNENIATMIDNVFYSTDASVHIGDIKTTYSLDKEYLSWQLSICAYLFEMQNPHLKVDKLYGIWLRKDKRKLIELPRKGDDIVKSLIESYMNDTMFENKESGNNDFSEIEELMSIDNELSFLNERRKEILNIIQPRIEKNGKYSNNSLSISFIPDSISTSFDTKKFKEENPGLASKYERQSTKSGYLKVTYKKQES